MRSRFFCLLVSGDGGAKGGKDEKDGGKGKGEKKKERRRQTNEKNKKNNSLSLFSLLSLSPPSTHHRRVLELGARSRLHPRGDDRALGPGVGGLHA